MCFRSIGSLDPCRLAGDEHARQRGRAVASEPGYLDELMSRESALRSCLQREGRIGAAAKCEDYQVDRCRTIGSMQPLDSPLALDANAGEVKRSIRHLCTSSHEAVIEALEIRSSTDDADAGSWLDSTLAQGGENLPGRNNSIEVPTGHGPGAIDRSRGNDHRGRPDRNGSLGVVRRHSWAVEEPSNRRPRAVVHASVTQLLRKLIG